MNETCDRLRRLGPAGADALEGAAAPVSGVALIPAGLAFAAFSSVSGRHMLRVTGAESVMSSS